MHAAERPDFRRVSNDALDGLDVQAFTQGTDGAHGFGRGSRKDTAAKAGVHLWRPERRLVR